MAEPNEGIQFENQTGTTQMRLPVVITLLAALLTGSVATALAGSPPPSSVPTENSVETSVETLALEWFAKMRTGQIDRTQLAADYSAQLTDDAVQAMSRYLKEYEYGGIADRCPGSEDPHDRGADILRGEACLSARRCGQPSVGFQRGEDYRHQSHEYGGRPTRRTLRSGQEQ
jgi:hypothetical protein